MGFPLALIPFILRCPDISGNYTYPKRASGFPTSGKRAHFPQCPSYPKNSSQRQHPRPQQAITLLTDAGFHPNVPPRLRVAPPRPDHAATPNVEGGARDESVERQSTSASRGPTRRGRVSTVYKEPVRRLLSPILSSAHRLVTAHIPSLFGAGASSTLALHARCPPRGRTLGVLVHDHLSEALHDWGGAEWAQGPREDGVSAGTQMLDHWRLRFWSRCHGPKEAVERGGRRGQLASGSEQGAEVPHERTQSRRVSGSFLCFLAEMVAAQDPQAGAGYESLRVRSPTCSRPSSTCGATASFASRWWSCHTVSL